MEVIYHRIWMLRLQTMYQKRKEQELSALKEAQRDTIFSFI